MHVIGLGILSKFSIPSPTLRTIEDNFEVTLSNVQAKSVVLKKALSSHRTHALCFSAKCFHVNINFSSILL